MTSLDEERVLEASLAGDAAAVDRLLAVQPSLVDAVDIYDKTPLHLAAEHDHTAVAEVVLAREADLEAETTWGMTPIEWAATVGSLGVGAQLVEAGARLNLYSAAGLGLVDHVRLFWDAGGRLRDDATTVSQALQVAARNGHVETVTLLLERGGDIDHPGYFGAPGLHWAAINGHAPMVAFLLEHGADAEIRDEEFDADALGWAREGGDEQTIAVLERAS